MPEADFAADIYAAVMRGEYPSVPVADGGVVSAASNGSWENLRRPDNRMYGQDVLTLRLIGLIRELEALVEDHHDVDLMHGRCGRDAMVANWGAPCAACPDETVGDALMAETEI